MGRRKKEPRSAHREHIASAAAQLFAEKSIAAVSMDDIAGKSGYSKATLYVYFRNKEEIISILVLKSMQMLYDCICRAVEEEAATKEKYRMICRGLAAYQKEYPLYFEMVLENINIDFENTECIPEEKETYLVGERINEKLKQFFEEGVKKGDLRPNMEILPTIFQFWGMLSGLIQLAAQKEEYIGVSMGLSQKQFLESGFEMLYRSVAKEEKHGE